MRQATRKLLVPLVFLGSVTLVGCSDGDGGDNTVTVILNAACTSTVTGNAGPRVYLDCGSVSQNLVTVEIWGENITDEFDGYNILIRFDPAAFRYTGFVNTAHPFVQNCSDFDLDCRDNASSANGTGLVTYSVQIFGDPDPTGVQIGTANRQLLGQLLFEAVSTNNTSPTIDSPVTVAACDPSSGTTLFNFNPACSLGFEALGGIAFENSGLTLSATNP